MNNCMVNKINTSRQHNFAANVSMSIDDNRSNNLRHKNNNYSNSKFIIVLSVIAPLIAPSCLLLPLLRCMSTTIVVNSYRHKNSSDNIILVKMCDRCTVLVQ